MGDRTIKILVAAGIYPPDIGGPATYAKMLEEELPQHGIELAVKPFGEVRKYPKLVRHLVYAWRLRRHAKEADLIYALDSMSAGLPALIASKLSGTPYMVRLGGDYAWEQGQQRFGLKVSLDEYTKNRQAAPLPVRLLATIQSLVVRNALKVILPSDYLKGIVETWNKQSDNLVRIYSVLHPLKVEEDKQSLREQLAYSGLTVITAARLVPWKGIQGLIDVIKSIHVNNPDVSLIVVGEGVEEESLKTYVREMNMADQVRFTGRLSKDALGAAIKAADVFVLNTAYEGLSHQLLEAMDLEVPVVSTSVGGNPELIKNKETGLLVEFDDLEAIEAAINRLNTDSVVREILVKNAKERTKDFDKHKVTKELVDLIYEVTK